MISASLKYRLAHEWKGDHEQARTDFSAALDIAASDAGGQANQETAKVRLSLPSDAVLCPRRQVPWSNSSLRGEVYLAEK